MKQLLVIIFLLLGGCDKFPKQKKEVVDLEKPQEISLTKAPNQGKVCFLVIEISGYATGVVTLELLMDGKVYQKRMVSGRYSTAIFTDWYEDDAKIRLGVSDGVSRSCMLRYQFREFQKVPIQSSEPTASGRGSP